VDIVSLVRETVAHFDPLAHEQDIRLTCELDEPLLHPCLDENRIRQVLHNLLSNAFRYTPAGGRVTISAMRLGDPHAVEIAVTDTGAGISPEELPHVFDRFYRTDEVRGRDRSGSGLGLAIAKAIVEAQGGSIDAQSPGKGLGSTFTIRLPVE
jgi:signal transduction histidine kinase